MTELIGHLYIHGRRVKTYNAIQYNALQYSALIVANVPLETLITV